MTGNIIERVLEDTGVLQARDLLDTGSVNELKAAVLKFDSSLFSCSPSTSFVSLFLSVPNGAELVTISLKHFLPGKRIARKLPTNGVEA